MQTGAPLYIKDKINLIAKKKKKKKNALPTWKNCDGWTLNNFFFTWPYIVTILSCMCYSLNGQKVIEYSNTLLPNVLSV